MRVLRGLWRAALPIAQKFFDGIVAAVLTSRISVRRVLGPSSQVFPRIVPTDLPVIVINLKRRKDRREQVLHNLSNLGFEDVHVLEAVDGPEKYPNHVRGNAANLGCTESHLMAIESYLSADSPIAVCEDDNEFFGEPDTILAFISSFLESPEADVLCLVARNRGPRVPLSSEFDAAGWALAPSFYVVKPNARHHLIRAFEKSMSRLSRQRRRGPFDQVWRWTQRFRLVFAIPRIKVGRQRESFSDIQGRFFDGT